MRMTLICATALLGSTAAVAQDSILTLAGTQSASTSARAAGLSSITVPALPSGSFLGGGGTCASPTLIPAGPTAVNFPFDNSAPASAGVVTNPFEALCQHNGFTGIGNEEWWSWTATSTGVARMKTCSNLSGVDTKVAVYADDCPNIATIGALACKDDDPTCPTFETTLSWDIVSGDTYLIQLGTFVGPGGPAAGGPGDFSIEELPSRPAGQYDLGDGPFNSLGLGAAGEIMWLQVFDAGAGETVNAVETAFGTPGLPIDPDGTPATIAVYQGDPINGLTLLGTEAIVSANSATGLTTSYPLSTPFSVSGFYTVGVHTTVTATSRPTPGDQTVNSFGRAWVSWDATGTPMDLNDLTRPQVPPVEVQFGLNGANDAVWKLRVHTTPNGPLYNELCFGDGGNQMGCTNCPCGNNAPLGSGTGCVNSGGTGLRIIASGDASVSLPSGSTGDLRFGAAGAPANAFCILNSGDGVAPGNMANPCFGLNTGGLAAAFDGLRCAITNTRRHGGRSADANGDIGVLNSPWGGEGGPPVGLAIAGGGFSSGQTRFFQIVNRDDPLVVCMRGLNTSQAVEVTFAP